MRSAGWNDAGFTLVEMLVSMALLSLMAIYALSALSSLRDFNRVAGRVGSQAEVAAVARYFHEAISDARLIYAVDENNSPRFIFQGLAHSIEFVSASNGQRETGGLYLVRYSVDAEGTLIAQRQILRDKSRGEPSRVTLLRGVKDVVFGYHASDSENIMETWERKDILPSAVDVSVIFENDDDRKWPPLLVSVWTAK